MIILIGLPKSGTTSFQALFEKLNYKSYHQKIGKTFIGMIIKHNKLRRIPLLTGFNKSWCITQMDVCNSINECYWPQITDYQQLYYENPDAVFILNKRDPHEILKSFKKWNRYNERLYIYNPELIKDKNDQGFINFVNQHYENVEIFFESKPEAKFIVYDIINDTVEKLGKYIDLRGIKVFPHENKNIKK